MERTVSRTARAASKEDKTNWKMPVISTSWRVIPARTEKDQLEVVKKKLQERFKLSFIKCEMLGQYVLVSNVKVIRNRFSILIALITFIS